MTKRNLFIACVAGMGAMAAAGCAQHRGEPSSAQGAAFKTIDPEQVQASTMSFAARYVVATSDVYDRVQVSAMYPQAYDLAQQTKLQTGLGALGNAVNPNPIVGLMDMALMVALSERVMEDSWAKETLGSDNDAMIVAALKTEEADIWNVSGNYLSPDQMKELRTLTQRWRETHPNQHYVGGARLTDFPEAKGTTKSELQRAASIFGLVQLDPFAGLDPAVRQVEESRILAERMFYYLQNMPTLLSWQTDVLYNRMISQPPMAQLFKDTSKFTTNTTDFTQATGRFADASADFAKSIETFRTQLPEQQATLVKQLGENITVQREGALKQADADIAGLRDESVKQLNELVAKQREDALKQAGAEIAAQRDAAIQQLAVTVSAQQDLMTRHLHDVMDRSIDRLYERLVLLVLIAAGALFTVLVLHRLAGRVLANRVRGASPPGE